MWDCCNCCVTTAFSNCSQKKTLLNNVDVRFAESVLQLCARHAIHDALSMSTNAASKSLADFCAWRRRCDWLRSANRRAAVCSAVSALRRRLSQSRFDDKRRFLLLGPTRLHLSSSEYRIRRLTATKRLYPCPHLYQFAAKSVHSFTVFRRLTDERKDGRTARKQYASGQHKKPKST